MPSISHDEATKIVDKWMEREGIRSFCTKVCKGRCCGDCEVPTCMFGKRKLACSMFVCIVIIDACYRAAARADSCKHLIDLENSFDIYGKVSSHVDKEIKKHTDSMFFGPLTENFLNNSRFDKEVVESLMDVKLPCNWGKYADLYLLKHKRD